MHLLLGRVLSLRVLIGLRRVLSRHLLLGRILSLGILIGLRRVLLHAGLSHLRRILTGLSHGLLRGVLTRHWLHARLGRILALRILLVRLHFY